MESPATPHSGGHDTVDFGTRAGNAIKGASRWSGRPAKEKKRVSENVERGGKEMETPLSSRSGFYYCIGSGNKWLARRSWDELTAACRRAGGKKKLQFPKVD